MMDRVSAEGLQVRQIDYVGKVFEFVLIRPCGRIEPSIG